MRSPVPILLTVALTSVTALTYAGELDEQYLAQCKIELSQRYGEALEVRLVSMRRSGNGVSMKVAVRLDSGTADLERVEFTSCRVGRDEVSLPEKKTGANSATDDVSHPAAPARS